MSASLAIRRLDELSSKELLAPGHSACAGCGATAIVRQILLASPRPLIVVNATGCIEVVTTPYPYTAWTIPYIHAAFGNAAAVASGVEAALKALERKGLGRRHDILVLAGDGGTFDIGLQSLSGAAERGHKMTFVCYDNEAYMNTGVQRSGATSYGARTSTTPNGKIEVKKDIVSIMVAHGIPYAATATPAHWKDLVNKVRKAFSYDGFTFLHILAPCPLGWYFEPKETIRMARLAVETRYFPLYEVERGEYKISYHGARPRQLEEFLAVQQRFSHLLEPENREMLERLKTHVGQRWQWLEELASRGTERT